jgi:hypothetical protein
VFDGVFKLEGNLPCFFSMVQMCMATSFEKKKIMYLVKYLDEIQHSVSASHPYSAMNSDLISTAQRYENDA